MNLYNLKTVFRSFLKNKLIFSLCVLGLSVGFAVFTVVIMHYRFEHSYDKMHAKSNEIYRMHAIYGTEAGYMGKYATSDNGYGPALKEELPEVLDYVRMLAYQSERIVSYTPENTTTKKYREPNVFLVDPNFFSFFDYKLKVGSPVDVLSKPNTIVISEAAASKFFGEENPLGKILTVSTVGQPYECEVTGIFYDVPDNSNLQFNYLVSFETLKQGWPDVDNSWNYAISYTYLQVAKNTDIRKLEDQIMEVFFEKSGVVAQGDLIFDMELVHFPEIHLNEPIQWELEKKGNRAETKYLLGIAIIIIIISCLNYMNISTSLAVQQNKNTRIKYILGSRKYRIVLQFITEAFLVNLVSIFIAVLIILLVSPLINTFFQNEGIDFIFGDPVLFLVISGILISGTLVTGTVSAIFFFTYNPDILFQVSSKKAGTRFRRLMVIAQFSTAVLLIIGSFLVYKQIDHLRSQELGVDLNQLVVIKSPANSSATPNGLKIFRQFLASNPNIVSISAGSDIPGQFMDMGFMISRPEANPPVHEVTDGGQIDYDYVETLGLEIVAGEDFSINVNSDRKILINEAMVRFLKFNSSDEAIGKTVQLPEMYGKQPVTILGVLKNYRQQSPSHNYKPVFFFCLDNAFLSYNYFIVKYGGETHNVITSLDEAWTESFPSSSFDYYFLNDHYQKQYGGNIRFGRLTGFLSFMAILIAVLGLLGLSINIAQQRIKEIGIRKVNGAKVYEVLAMLNWDFARWIIISIVVGSLVAYFVMTNWLDNFAVRTTISWWIFPLTGLVVLVFALLTVSYHSYKAATTNPVQSLRHE